MENSHVAFQILGKEYILPVGYKKITWYLKNDIILDLTRKSRYSGCGLEQTLLLP